MKDSESQSETTAAIDVASPTRREMTPWQSVAEALTAEGVQVLFALPSDPPQLYDDLDLLHEQGRIRVVGVRHEVSGPFMAMAYARVTGRAAACYASSGPGVANLVAGVLEAYSGCTPMLVLGVRAPRTHFGMGAFQEVDQVSLLRPITKWATTVETPELVPWTMRRAVQIARTGRPGPVYVELPADLGADLAEIPEYEPAPAGFRPGPDGQAVLEAAKLIAVAKRPLIITGGGTIASGAGEAVARFAHKFGIPIQTTPGGRGSVAETDSLFCGLVGLYRTTFPKKVYEAADLIITVGAQMEEFQGGFLARNPSSKYIQIEIDAFAMGRNWNPDVPVQSDARLAVEALDAALTDIGVEPDLTLVEEIREGREKAIADARREVKASMESGSMPMKGMAIVSEINRVFGHDTIICNENGSQDLWAYYWPYYQVLDTGCCVPPAEQTAMGLGIVGAIAAKLAAPEKRVVCTTGDGAFTMTCHELATAAQESIGATWVVLNDGALGWVQWMQRRMSPGGRVFATSLNPPIDVVATAAAAGWEGARVSSPPELAACLEQALEANGRGVPFVIDVPVDQSHHHAEFERFHGLEPATGSGLA